MAIEFDFLERKSQYFETILPLKEDCCFSIHRRLNTEHQLPSVRLLNSRRRYSEGEKKKNENRLDHPDGPVGVAGGPWGKMRARRKESHV